MHDNLSRLAQIQTHPYLMASLYLALDQKREARLQTLGNLVKSKEQQLAGNGAAGQWKQLSGEMARMTRYVEDMPMGPDRGLVMFSRGPAGIFETHALSMPVPNLLEVGPAPYIRPLAALAQDHRPTLVVLLDRRQARFFTGYLGGLEENTQLAITTEQTTLERSGSQSRADSKRVARKNQETAGRHYREIDSLIMERFKAAKFKELVLGGSKPAVEAMQKILHPYLEQRLVGTFTAEVNAAASTVLAEVTSLQPQARRQRQEQLLDSLADNLGPKGLAATGLNQVLAALHEGQVHTLFVQRGYVAAGGCCPGCGRLRHVAGTCPICNEKMLEISDVVNLAITRAIESSAALEQIDGPSKLDELGNIAALLRYA